MNFPETDLHLHLDGSLSIDVVKRLALEQGHSLHESELKKLLSVSPNCQSLIEYLKCFDLPGKLLQRKEALFLAAEDLTGRLAAAGLCYAEIRFAPQLHLKEGLKMEQAVEAVVKGVEKGLEGSFMKAGVLLCAMVNGADKENEETLELARAYQGKGVVGADLAGPEGFVPMEHFEPLFRKAYKEGLFFTIHAGECGDPENIVKAVSYGARRIGHGCGAILSEACMERLKKEKITLEMCVTSNLQTKAVSSIKEHPLKAFYDRGISVTYNTDNISVSDTSLEQERSLLKEYLGFSEEDLVKMNRMALKGAFLKEDKKEKLIAFFDKNIYNG